MRSVRDSIHAFDRIQSEGSSPTKSIIAAALKACGRVGDFQSGKRIHDYIIKNRRASPGFHGDDGIDADIASALVTMYAKCRSIDEAREVFDAMEDRSVVSWSAMILGYAENGKGDLALGLFQRMKQDSDDSIAPNRVTYLAALKACAATCENSREQALETARALHLEICQNGLESDLFVASTLVDLYWKCGSSVDARDLFGRMEERNVVSWSAMILGFAEAGDAKLALETFRRMPCAPNRVTYLAVIKACAALAVVEEGELVDGKVVKLKSLEIGRALHCQIRGSGFELHASIASSLVDMYCKCGSLGEAWSIFQRMKRSFRDVVSWSAMILGYAQGGQAEMALELFEKMEGDGCAPNPATFVAMLKACASQGFSGAGRRIHAKICTAGVEGQPGVATSLVDFYGKSGSMNRARQVFESMASIDLVTWNALLAGYSHQGEITEVLEAFEALCRTSLAPDSVTYLTVLTACAHAGHVENGKEVFRAMTQRSITPGIEHYSCLVDLLGRANLLDEAVAVLRGMSGASPTPSLWMSVLGACHKWKNVDVGRAAYGSILELDPCNSAAYVLMANILQHSSEWDLKNSPKLRL
ncbi:pentatricopeptide repeat-containing protein At1g11290, chloroplastic-like [Selaginella moellendorffii]|uniref:pentatricopeptide repeat-containing protein At1g11290, chloroplastic-like n=1 Tax=Selaginella moellendorffii TaxID=88036 RepID=UPI000D1CC604|nr:pentatricopeptide repeat-containing protein At1g11290, chloroplastic-like [Selaginella moellendorffii]|eukprot:XP_024518871.1 pentatricopeptide repeat-containing protein At1g11290, chloroplastic-like [Selaginella moellendorffii]